jgi:hypothetical protein
MAAKNSPFYWPTDGNAAVPGNLVVTGNERINGNLTMGSLASQIILPNAGNVISVNAGSVKVASGQSIILDPSPQGIVQVNSDMAVDGKATFVCNGTASADFAIATERTSGPDTTGVFIGNAGNVGTPSIQAYLQNGVNPPGSYALELNPAGGEVATGADLIVGADLTVDGIADISGACRSETGFSATSNAGPGTYFATMTSDNGDIACDGDFHVYPAASGPFQTPGTEVHRLDSTANSTNNYLTANGGKIGIGGIRVPTQQIDVSGNVQVTGAFLANGYILAQQLNGAYECGLFASGDAVVGTGTSSIGVDLTGIVPNFTPGGRVLATYKNGANGGGPLSVTPGIGLFTISTGTLTPVALDTTVSWMVVSRG